MSEIGDVSKTDVKRCASWEEMWAYLRRDKSDGKKLVSAKRLVKRREKMF